MVRINTTEPRDPVRNIGPIQPNVQDVPALAAQYPDLVTDFERTYHSEPFHPVFLHHVRKFSTIRFAVIRPKPTGAGRRRLDP